MYVHMSDDDKEPLNAAQWAAARMLIARLRSEAAYEPFDFGEIGVTWLATDDVICATTDSGELLRLGDVFYAAIVMLWSLVIAHADATGEHPVDIVAQLGIGVAQHDPS